MIKFRKPKNQAKQLFWIFRHTELVDTRLDYDKNQIILKFFDMGKYLIVTLDIKDIISNLDKLPEDFRRKVDLT